MGRRSSLFDSSADKDASTDEADKSLESPDAATPPSPPQDAENAQDAAPASDAPAAPSDSTDKDPASDDAPQDDPAEPDHADYHENGQPHIGIDLFVAAHPTPNDQLAGFRHYARNYHPGKYTMADWLQHLLAFNSREIK